VSAVVVAGAMVLDALAGDPRRFWTRSPVPHPVTLMGRSLMVLERRFNAPEQPEDRRRVAGAVSLVLYLTLWTGLAVAILALASGPGDALVSVIFGAVLLAGRDLIDHVGAVARALEASDDPGPAREAVSHIVGRDPSRLDRPGVARAAIESLAENLSDGFIAPVFWFALGGLPALVCYKAINTADSLIGHRSDRFAAFGWAAARLDDLANYIPARVTAGLIALAAAEDDRMQESWLTANRDAGKHLSPNAGWPEAAMAGALDIRLGGPRRYGDREVAGAWFGDGSESAGPSDLRRALRLAKRVWIGSIVVAVIVALSLLNGGLR
jgi:adenosylcobinamide-phosphate synthase